MELGQPSPLGHPPHDVQHVQSPAAFLDGNGLERFDLLELCADFLWRRDDGLRGAGVRAGGFGERPAPCSTGKVAGSRMRGI